jgi:RNA recognition motif-containing protein
MSHSCKIFVGNYSKKIAENYQTALVDIFQKYGKITVVRQTVGNFSYITFSTPEEAYSALNENGRVHDRLQIRVEPVSAGKPKLFVSNLPPTFSEKEILKIFEKYGKIKSKKENSKQFIRVHPQRN